MSSSSEIPPVPSALEMAASHVEVSRAESASSETTSDLHTPETLDDGFRVARPRRAAPADAVRPTRAEINLGHLRHNLRVLERAMGRGPGSGGDKQRPAIWPVLKADAYGHGAPATARTLERAGAAGLCVALLEEAIELREAGIRIPILVMGGYYGPQDRGLEEALHHDLIPVIYEAEQIERLARIVRSTGGSSARVHLKIDTGMARLGVAPEDLDSVLERFVSHREVVLDGLMSHLACADATDLAPTMEQLARFERARGKVRAFGLAPRVCHVANSAGALRAPASRFDLVRPGIAVYGVAPCAFDDAATSPESEALRDLRPVMRVRSEIVALRTIRDGEHVGYGHTFQAHGTRTIATIAMGYADGLSRGLSNKGHVLVRGKRAPIAGVISMDLASIDVSDIPMVRIGDEAVVLGAQEGPLGSDQITAEEIASHTGTIAWEPLTHISRRVPRFYREP